MRLNFFLIELKKQAHATSTGVHYCKLEIRKLEQMREVFVGVRAVTTRLFGSL